MSDRRVRVYYSTGAPARSHKSCTDDFQAAFPNSPYHANKKVSRDQKGLPHGVCSYLGPYDTVDSAYCITFVPVQRWLQKMGAAGKLPKRVPTHRAQLIFAKCPCSASTWDDGAHEPAGTPHAQA